MVQMLGNRQQQLLRLLLNNKKGMTIDQLASALNVTRTAVSQHLTTLERDGYVEKGDLQKTRGRPRHLYRLTELEIGIFPKQYAWFAELLLDALARQQGEEGLTRTLHQMGGEVATTLGFRLTGKNTAEKVSEVVKILNEMGYEAGAISYSRQKNPLTIEAKNCVYFSLARKYEQVCHFDLGLLSHLLQREVELTECMFRGGNSCRFKFHSKADSLSANPAQS